MIATKERIFPARVIAEASGVSVSSVRRRAQRESWPRRRRGNRVEYGVPRHLLCRCRSLSDGPSIFDQPKTLRELKRAAAVLGFVFEMLKHPRLGTEKTLKLTTARYWPLMRFSPRQLRRWVAAVEREGITALQERKRGRVGRKSARLERILQQ